MPNRDAADTPVPERQLAEAEQRWQQILATSNDAFVGIDEHSVITDWNRRAEELFGWSADEVVGAQLAETIIPPEFRSRHHAGMRRFLEEGEGTVLFRPLEVPALHRSGGRIPVDLRIWPVRIDDRWQFHAFLRDLSQQHRLQAHMELLREVTDAANAAMEAREAVEFALARICWLTGWPAGHAYLATEHPDRLEPSGWWHLEHDLSHFPAATEDRAFAAGEGLPGRVLETRRPEWVALGTDDNFPRSAAAFADGLHSGFAFPVMVGSTVAAVLEFYTPETVDADEDLLDLVGQVGTQLGRVFERQRAIENHAEASQTRLWMMSMLSHDVGNPLAVIRGYASALAEDADEVTAEELGQYTAGIVRMSERLDDLMANLLTGFRAESGHLTTRPEALDVHEMVTRAAADLLLDRIQVEIPPGLTVRGDRGHFLQIIDNLLINAQKYGAPPIEVGGESDDDRTVVTVTDHGPGLPSELAVALFTPFSRGPTADSTTGTGLGLWICRLLARQNGGDLSHVPGPGTGARFVLELPAVPTEG